MYWWENEFLKVRNNQLHIGGHEAKQIAEDSGTPLFVYSKLQTQTNFRTLIKAFHKNTALEPRICYAMKANANPELLKILLAEGAWIDAVSPGEIAIARNVGFPGSKIYFTGTSSSLEDFQKVFAHNDVIANIDAQEQLDIMWEAKEKWFKHKTIKVSLRWNPGIGKGFSPKTITAGRRSTDGTPIKFGVEESRVIFTLQRASDMGFIPVGLHQHLGSGWTKNDYEDVKIAVDKIIQLALEVQAQGFRLEFLDFGGGFGPKYSQSEELFPLMDYIGYICRKIEETKLNLKAIAVEPGKYMVSNSGVLLFRVEYLKQSYGNLFACVNAGTFNSAPRPAIYTQAHHQIINCSNVHTNNPEKITVAGNLCETGDVFGKEILMPIPEKGSILALLHAGAYCRSMASNYNLREIPREIIV